MEEVYRIAKVHAPSFMSPLGIGLDIAFFGCMFKCEGCHNPRLQDFLFSDNLLTFEDVKRKMHSVSHESISTINIYGGEPLHQHNIVKFLEEINSRYKTHITLYTGFEWEEVPAKVKQFCKMIKTGRYIKDLRHDTYNGKAKLASKNQKYHIKDFKGEWFIYDGTRDIQSFLKHRTG